MACVLFEDYIQVLLSLAPVCFSLRLSITYFFLIRDLTACCTSRVGLRYSYQQEAPYRIEECCGGKKQTVLFFEKSQLLKRGYTAEIATCLYQDEET